MTSSDALQPTGDQLGHEVRARERTRTSEPRPIPSRAALDMDVAHAASCAPDLRVRDLPIESEHRVRVRSLFRNPLQHVPVLDDLAGLIESKDVDAGPVPIVGPVLVAGEDHEITVREHASEFDPLTGVLARHPLEVL